MAVVAVESQATNLPLLMSKFVTDEAVIDDSLAKRIGITDDDMTSWATETEQIYNKINSQQTEVYDRSNINDSINTKGYNIRLEAKRLEELYCAYSKN